jgi:hypothetical protein
LNREPRADEQERLLRFIRQQRDSNKTEQATWTAIARVLLNVDEFLTRE